MLTKLLKLIGIIGLFGFLWLMPKVSMAIDDYIYWGYAAIDGDINLEFRSEGRGGKDSDTEIRNAFIHNYNLGLRTYIWDPRFIQVNLAGRFYQQIDLSDRPAHERDFYSFGGQAILSFFPRSILPTTLIYGRDMYFNPDLVVTRYGVDAQLLKPRWPGIYLNADFINYFSDEKDREQDIDYLGMNLRLVHTIYFKPPRVSINGNGNGNGNGREENEKERNGNGRKTVLPSYLRIDAFYSYYRTDDHKAHISSDQHTFRLWLSYFFNNNQSYIFNVYDWYRANDNDNFRVSLSYFNHLPTQLSYNLSGFLAYSRSGNNDNTFSGGLSAGLTKIFSPRWTASAGASGQFTSASGGKTSLGFSGFGNIFSRIFPNLDWGAGLSAGVNTGQGDTNSNYNLSLTGLYRLAPNKTLAADYNLSFASNDAQSLDNRLRLTFNADWAPRFAFRSVADFRYIHTNDVGGRGNSLGISLDNYGIYRLAPQTTLSAGIYFSHVMNDSDSNQFFRVYASLNSTPWPNLGYSVTADLTYDVKDAAWSAHLNSQVYYVWRRLYFSLSGDLTYSGGNSSGDWNYRVSLKVTRPFNLRF